MGKKSKGGREGGMKGGGGSARGRRKGQGVKRRAEAGGS